MKIDNINMFTKNNDFDVIEIDTETFVPYPDVAQ